MKSFEEMEEAKLIRWNTPALLGVSAEQKAATCPHCASLINDDLPPYDRKPYESELQYMRGNISETYPHCPACSKRLLIQCHDLTAETRLSELNSAQKLRVDEAFRKLGAVLTPLQSGRFQVLFAGTRTNYSPDFTVLSVYERIANTLLKSVGFTDLKEVHCA